MRSKIHSFAVAVAVHSSPKMRVRSSNQSTQVSARREIFRSSDRCAPFPHPTSPRPSTIALFIRSIGSTCIITLFGESSSLSTACIIGN